MALRTLLLVAQLVVVGSESPAAVTARIRLFTCVDPHVSVPGRSVVQRLAADRTLLSFLWIPHPGIL